MKSKEEVIRALRICAEWEKGMAMCPECPYKKDSSQCFSRLIRDAADLLEGEQK